MIPIVSIHPFSARQAPKLSVSRATLYRTVATKQDLQALEGKLELVKHQLITRLGGLMVVLAGLLFAALHYWPPHG